MQPKSDQDITQILAQLSSDPQAAHRLLPLIYEELRGIAGRVFSAQHFGQNSIQPTILVHDVFLKLAQKTDISWASRAHFFAVAAKATRDLLVDHARRERAAKRGGRLNRVTLVGLDHAEPERKIIDVIDLEEALLRLRELAPRQERIVEMRFFAGLTVEEVARILELSPRTVSCEWRIARAWLRSQLEDE